MESLVRKIGRSNSMKNGLWMYLLQFFNTVIPLFTVPYVTRILGSSKYGVFSIAINLVVYMQVVVEYGFGMSATRKVALDNKKETINRIFTGVLYARLLLLMACFLFTLTYIFIQRQNVELCISLMVLNICLLGYCVQVNWLFQGLQEMKFISIVNIVGRTISVILIFLFVRSNSDLYLYCIFYSISPFLSGAIGWLLAKKRYAIAIIKVTWRDVINELKDGWFVFTTQLSSKVFGAIGITILGIFATEQDVGIYSAIQKITNVLILCWTPISQVLYPLSSQHLQKNYVEGKKFVWRIRSIVLPIFIIISIVLGVFSKTIVNIAFGSEYVMGYYWLLPLLAWVIVSIVNNFTGIQILLGSGHDKEYSKCFQIGVICTIILNLGLIYMFKGDGASVAPVISESILLVLLTREVRRIDKKSIANIGDETV